MVGEMAAELLPKIMIAAVVIAVVGGIGWLVVRAGRQVAEDLGSSIVLESPEESARFAKIREILELELERALSSTLGGKVAIVELKVGRPTKEAPTAVPYSFEISWIRGREKGTGKITLAENDKLDSFTYTDGQTYEMIWRKGAVSGNQVIGAAVVNAESKRPKFEGTAKLLGQTSVDSLAVMKDLVALLDVEEGNGVVFEVEVTKNQRDTQWPQLLARLDSPGPARESADAFFTTPLQNPYEFERRPQEKLDGLLPRHSGLSVCVPPFDLVPMLMRRSAPSAPTGTAPIGVRETRVTESDFRQDQASFFGWDRFTANRSGDNVAVKAERLTKGGTFEFSGYYLPTDNPMDSLSLRTIAWKLAADDPLTLMDGSTLWGELSAPTTDFGPFDSRNMRGESHVSTPHGTTARCVFGDGDSTKVRIELGQGGRLTRFAPSHVAEDANADRLTVKIFVRKPAKAGQYSFVLGNQQAELPAVPIEFTSGYARPEPARNVVPKPPERKLPSLPPAELAGPPAPVIDAPTNSAPPRKSNKAKRPGEGKAIATKSPAVATPRDGSRDSGKPEESTDAAAKAPSDAKSRNERKAALRFQAAQQLKTRDPRRAIELAEEAIQLAPESATADEAKSLIDEIQ